MRVIGKARVMERSVGIVKTVNTQFCEGFFAGHAIAASSETSL